VSVLLGLDDVVLNKVWKAPAAFAAALGGLLWAPIAHAGVVDEVSVGWYAHDFVNITDGVESNLQDVQFELDTKRPPILRFIGAPRLSFVATVNGPGKTDVFAAGVKWDHAVWRKLYVTLDFGLGYSNGLVNPPTGPGTVGDEDYDHYKRLLLGSSVLFRTVPGLMWKIDKHWVVEGELIHLSNGGVLGNHHFNRGINDLGVSVGYHFN
jgi:hypothetical protein